MLNSTEVAKLYILGRTPAEVAKELQVSRTTIVHHFAKLKDKGVVPLTVLELASIVLWPDKTPQQVLAHLHPYHNLEETDVDISDIIKRATTATAQHNVHTHDVEEV